MYSNIKSAVVTGGAGGIGNAVVRSLCRDGYSVVINYLNSEAKAKALVSELVFAGNRVAAFKADISNSGEAQRLIDYANEMFGTPYLLVNNAGIAQQKLFTDITDDDWNKMIGVNLTGTFNCCKSVLPYMIRAKQGRIVNISSMWGQIGASCEVHYSAAKAGVIGLTKALAKEVAPCGITVNSVAAGAVDTAMMSSFSAEDLNALCDEIPLMRIANPQEIADSVAFLASEKAAYITGQVLGVNGGMVV